MGVKRWATANIIERKVRALRFSDHYGADTGWMASASGGSVQPISTIVRFAAKP
ncbi:MAG TPA: hypothetical protein VGY98_19135 [Verrucomicrobiae bacterium]|nr:hypothetical protein [Verrucomicrobiae bacterium]